MMLVHANRKRVFYLDLLKFVCIYTMIVSTNVYRGIWLIVAVVLWITAEKKDRQRHKSEFVGETDDKSA